MNGNEQYLDSSVMEFFIFAPYLVDAFTQVATVALLERYDAEWIVVFANFLPKQRHLNVNRRDWCPFPIVSRESEAVRLIALHAQRLLNVHRIQFVDSWFGPIDRTIVHRTSSICFDLLLMLSPTQMENR